MGIMCDLVRIVALVQGSKMWGVEASAFVNGLRLAARCSPHKGTICSKLISPRRKQGHAEESKLCQQSSFSKVG